MSKKNCIGCGDCCSRFLILTKEEIATLQQEAKERNILINKNKFDCPFLSAEKTCVIYEKRPMICRAFHCDHAEAKDIPLFMMNNMIITDLCEVLK